jgi:hypothetical protein
MFGVGISVIRLAGPRPAAPLNVTVKQVRSDLLITWSPGHATTSPPRRQTGSSNSSSPLGSAAVERYVIQYRTVGHHWVPLVDRLQSNVTSYLWTTASRGATYHFRVIAVTRTAHSEPSVVVSLRTGGKLFFLHFGIFSEAGARDDAPSDDG